MRLKDAPVTPVVFVVGLMIVAGMLLRYLGDSFPTTTSATSGAYPTIESGAVAGTSGQFPALGGAYDNTNPHLIEESAVAASAGPGY